jgi:hypothetical protein
MMSFKGNAQLNNAQSVMVRVALQRDYKDGVTWTTNNDMREVNNARITAQSVVVQHSLVLGSRGLNQLTAHVNHMRWFDDSVSNVTRSATSEISPMSTSYRRAYRSRREYRRRRRRRITIEPEENRSRTCRCCWARTRSSSARTTLPARPRPRERNEHFATLVFFDDPSVIQQHQRRYPGVCDTGDRAVVATGQRRCHQRQRETSPPTFRMLLNSVVLQDDWRVTSADPEPRGPRQIST